MPSPAVNHFPSCRLLCKSAEKMTEAADGSVALTVTSPPYWNAIDYDRYETARDENYRTREYAAAGDGYEHYLDFCGRVFGEVLRATKPGGFCAVVIGTLLEKGRLFPVPFDFSRRMTLVGWEFHQDIIWHKTTAGVRRAGVVIQKPYPGYYYPNIMTEYILVFRKAGEPIYRAANGAREQSRFAIDDVFKRDTANNIWHVAPVPPKFIDHPCPFPEEIPHRLIAMYSHAGETVLDPFVGSGQTAKVARALGREALGYDTNARFIRTARARVKEPLRLRERQLIARFEKIPLNVGGLPIPPRKRAGRGDAV